MTEFSDEYEKERLKALRSYQLLDTLSEEEFDELTLLAAQICGTPISLISLVDEERQWFKSVQGLDKSETPISQSFCAHAIRQPDCPMIVEDARLDERFQSNPLVTGENGIVFYAGIPLVDHQNYALGSLCVIDHQPRQLTSQQISSLKVLAKSVVRLIESRRSNAEMDEQLSLIKQVLTINNPFFLIINERFELEEIGQGFQRVAPELSHKDPIDQHFTFNHPFSLEGFVSSEQIQSNRLIFLSSINHHHRYKCSLQKMGDKIIIAGSPVVNNEFKLKDYGLRINDFAQHDYIAEYLFLQQTTDRSLKDSKALTEKLVRRNEELSQMQKDILSLSRFPDENPSPVLRFKSNMELSYCNEASRKMFNSDFAIDELTTHDDDLRALLDDVKNDSESQKSIILAKNERHYSITAKYVEELDYINLYVKDITVFVNDVRKAMDEMSTLNAKVQEQREFYEFILNNIPADIAVFDTDHKYVFVNPQGIQNKEVRDFIIGKDDFDYCRFRGIPEQMAIDRRKLYQRIIDSRDFVTWEDDTVNAQGERRVVYRRMGPLFDENGQIKNIIGYGVTITDRKEAEERLLAANKRMALLENFLNRTSDAIQVANESGQMVYINFAASERLGIEPTKIQNYHVWDFETTLRKEGLWQKHFSDVKTAGSLQREGENENQLTGEKITVEVNLQYEKIDDTGYIIAASRDISERKRSEAEIRKLSLVAKNTNNGILMLDQNRLITWANESMVKRSGYVLSELIGQSPKIFHFHNTDSNITARIYRNMMACRPVTEEVQHRAKDGTTYWVNLNIQPLFDEQGIHTGYMAVEFDISERKQFEITIAEQNKNLKEITDALDQRSLVSIADSRGIILKVNQRFCEVSKYTEEELIGQPHNIINSGVHPKSFWRDVWKQIAAGEIWSGEICNRAKDGSLYWVDSVIYPIRDFDGKVDRYLSIRHNITDRKILEEREKNRNKFLIEKQSALVHISQLPASLNLQDRLSTIAGIDAQITHSDRVSIWLMEDKGSALSCIVNHSLETDTPEAEELTIRREDFPHFFEDLSTTHGAIIAPNARIHPALKGFNEYYLQPKNIESVLAVPIRSGNRVLGVLAQEFKSAQEKWSDDDINFLRSIADQTALSIENFERQKAEANLRRKSMLQDILMEISNQYINIPLDTVDGVILSSLERISQFIHSDRAYICKYSQAEKSISERYEWLNKGVKSGESSYETFDVGDIPFWSIHHNEGKIFEKKSKENSRDELFFKARGINGIIAIPMLEEGRCTGFIAFESVHEEREFSADEKDLLLLLSQMLVNVESRLKSTLAIAESNRKIQVINAELEYIVKAEKTVNMLAESFLNGTDSEEICWDIVENVISQLDFDDCVIYKVDNDILVQVAAIGNKVTNKRELRNPLKLPLGKGVVGHVAKTGKYKLIKDTSTEPMYIVDDQIRLSEISIPIKIGDRVWGVIDSEHPEKNFFTPLHLRVLMTIANMLAQKITALDEQAQKEKLQQEILEINANLENRVAEEINRNIELTKSITDQEKLVTLGEISSGIAHDLNTPLGAIKTGAESIQFAINELLNHTIYRCTERQIKLACDRAELMDEELFIGGLQLIRESNSMKEWLRIKYTTLSDDYLQEITPLLVKARIKIEEEQLLDEIIHSSNSIEFLQLIYHIKMIRTFVDTILKSSDRAARVVQDLRSFIKEQKNTGKTKVNLYQNITTVLNIFNFELKRTAQVECEIDENLYIEGFDIKLFQLWSNLIKNAIEAMEESDRPGLLRIYTKQKEKTVSVVINNNGPKIPEEIQADIFQKFYTTKASKNGTGLGLNIVKNIIDDHNATIELISKEDHTDFIITFTQLT